MQKHPQQLACGWSGRVLVHGVVKVTQLYTTWQLVMSLLRQGAQALTLHIILIHKCYATYLRTPLHKLILHEVHVNICTVVSDSRHTHPFFEIFFRMRSRENDLIIRYNLFTHLLAHTILSGQ